MNTDFARQNMLLNTDAEVMPPVLFDTLGIGGVLFLGIAFVVGVVLFVRSVLSEAVTGIPRLLGLISLAVTIVAVGVAKSAGGASSVFRDLSLSGKADPWALAGSISEVVATLRYYGGMASILGGMALLATLIHSRRVGASNKTL